MCFLRCPLLVLIKMKDRIYQLMKQQGMSQKQFANELCVGEATLSSIFTGRTRPTNNMVAAIHERFPEVSISWLMFGEGDMYAGETIKVKESPVSAEATSDDLFSQPNVGGESSAISAPVSATPAAPIIRETIKYIDKPQRKITEIRVFFDDGTYEIFAAKQ